jgi:hypothetical protein
VKIVDAGGTRMPTTKMGARGSRRGMTQSVWRVESRPEGHGEQLEPAGLFADVCQRLTDRVPSLVIGPVSNPSVRRTRPVPSRLTAWVSYLPSRFRVNASRMPSGDQHGRAWIPFNLVTHFTSAPSASITYRPNFPSRLKQKAIRAPSGSPGRARRSSTPNRSAALLSTTPSTAANSSSSQPLRPARPHRRPTLSCPMARRTLLQNGSSRTAASNASTAPPRTP